MVSRVTWPRIAITLIAAGSTYFLRDLLASVGLGGLTYLLPVLFAGYAFGAVLATVAAALSLLVAHLIIWREAPATLVLSRAYFGGISYYVLFAGLIILYAYRHERVLKQLDESLAREKAARQDAEQANRHKDQFLATLSHELRTPINVILGYLQILLAERTKNPRRALEIAHRNAEQQARLIEDVLDVSRITTGMVQLTREEVRPDALLREAVESLQPAIAEKGLHLVIDEADEPATILADPHRLRQVFWNLLSNAVKFTPDGGHIFARSAISTGHVEISVRDTGRGISKEFMPHVFEMFRQADSSPTRDASGMGLGLHLVKRFVELHEGSVSAQSPGEGQGATFVCRFPIHRRSHGVEAGQPVSL